MAAAHSRASSVEKEAPVKIEAPVTEMQETPVKFEAPVTEMQEEQLKQEAPVKVEAVITTGPTRRCDAEEIGLEEVVVSVVGDRGMTEVGEHVSEEGNVGASPVVLEGDLSC